MITKDNLIEKIKSLPEDKLEEVANFIFYLEEKDKGQADLVEYGMADYLSQLLIYEDMLSAGKIIWK